MAKPAKPRKPPARKRSASPSKLPAARATPVAALAETPISIVHAMDQDDLDDALAKGQHREALEEYFGPDLYRELSMLAAEVQRRRIRGGQRVGILPGIMGSELSVRRNGKDQLVWLSLLQVFLGGTRALKLGGSGAKTVLAKDVLIRYYTKLRLQLRNKGYDARFIPFDWRRSLAELGDELLEAVKGDGGKIHLVCHSMGGLVARAAAKKKRNAFDRVVQLGTPNFGSFSPVTAFRGVHPIGEKIEKLDVTQDMNAYIDLFASFPGLIEMVPNPDRYQDLDLFKLPNWPTGTRLTAKALSDARNVQKTALAGGDKKTWLIAGVDQETIVGAEVLDGEFNYKLSSDGDGTVPLDFAHLDGVGGTYYIAEEHGALPNNARVADAVDEILRNGFATGLPDVRAARAAPRERTATDTELARRAEGEAMRGRIPTPREERRLLEEFLSVESKDLAASSQAVIAAGQLAVPTAATPELQRSRSIVVGRRRQRGIELKLALGSVTEADARAIVLGVFEKVNPTGAAAAVNEALGGAVQRYIDRRMFNGALGEVTIIPATRRQLRTEFVIFAGLGAFDQFSPNQLQTVGANLARMLVDTSVEDIAIVPFGGSAGFASDVILRNFLFGFFGGLEDSDKDQCFRRLTICEIDPRRYSILLDEILHLTTTDLFSGFEATVDQIDLPAPRPARPGASRERDRRGLDPVYLIARRYSSRPDADQDTGDIFETSLLTSGAAAAILTERHTIDPKLLDKDFRKLDTGQFTEAKLKELGEIIRTQILGDKTAQALARQLDTDPAPPLMVVHDAGASRVPWEALRLGEFWPALGGGMSRRYMSRDLSVAKWLSGRTIDEQLDILLVVNPTEDLPGADEEGKRVMEIVAKIGGAKLKVVAHAEATRARLIDLFQSGEFDVVHYAGHAFFDPLVRQRSGILCAGDDVLSGVDLASLVSLPALFVCNACQSAQIRDAQRSKRRPVVSTEIGRNVSFAESFLRGGIANYVGTHWSVGDAPAKLFAETLYTRLSKGAVMNEAITAARQTVESVAASKDWADYIHYGDPNFLLKAGEARLA